MIPNQLPAYVLRVEGENAILHLKAANGVNFLLIFNLKKNDRY